MFLEALAFSYAHRCMGRKWIKGCSQASRITALLLQVSGIYKGHVVHGCVGRGVREVISSCFHKSMWCFYPYRAVHTALVRTYNPHSWKVSHPMHILFFLLWHKWGLHDHFMNLLANPCDLSSRSKYRKELSAHCVHRWYRFKFSSFQIICADCRQSVIWSPYCALWII